MPWKEVKPMEQKILFIADYLREVSSISELCATYGISRKTGYKWIQRYAQLGMDGLSEQSRSPATCPTKTPYHIQQAIIELRQQFQTTPGAKKLRVLLAQRYPDEVVPSKSTIYNILNRAGLVTSRRRRRRVSLYPQPFAPVHQVNEVWSVDYKGQFKLGNGQWCYPLTVMDHQSRYLCGCEALKGTRLKATQAAFIRLFRQYGLPERIRSDNGVPFASTARGGLSRLSLWWIRLGILPERIEPGKPQQNGRHERMHLTLKEAATRPPSANMTAQQQRLDRFRAEYNEQRPHEALDQNTPASCYSPSLRAYPERLPELHYPDYFEVRKVSSNGVVYWHNKMVYVSHLLKGELVGLEQIDDEIWNVYFGPVTLGRFDETDIKGKTVPYITVKV
ncbi:MAG: transposase [Gammaproteobacteria bacterium]|nr:DDE-type integrase/transposase/recombinase [Gammaproteobacteria bacterium]NNL06646.1 transposase [Gammaproteobacteria bacterium]